MTLRTSFSHHKKRRVRRTSLLELLELWSCTSWTIDGLWIGAWDDEPERYLRRVEEALSLIKTCSPIQYARVRRDLKRVWATVLPGPIGSFQEPLSACQIDTRFVLKENPDVIASVIVHEATHARLRRYGFGYEEELRPRVEAVCVRRELAFSQRLPNGERVREWAGEKLKFCARPGSLSDAALEQLRIDGSREALSHLGLPDWLARALMALAQLYLRIKGRKR
jgi:hypothetical protein